MNWWVKSTKALTHIKHLLIIASAITGCISAFASLLGIPIGITSTAME